MCEKRFCERCQCHGRDPWRTKHHCSRYHGGKRCESSYGGRELCRDCEDKENYERRKENARKDEQVRMSEQARKNEQARAEGRRDGRDEAFREYAEARKRDFDNPRENSISHKDYLRNIGDLGQGKRDYETAQMLTARTKNPPTDPLSNDIHFPDSYRRQVVRPVPPSHPRPPELSWHRPISGETRWISEPEIESLSSRSYHSSRVKSDVYDYESPPISPREGMKNYQKIRKDYFDGFDTGYGGGSSHGRGYGGGYPRSPYP